MDPIVAHFKTLLASFGRFGLNGFDLVKMMQVIFIAISFLEGGISIGNKLFNILFLQEGKAKGKVNRFVGRKIRPKLRFVTSPFYTFDLGSIAGSK